MNVCLKEFLGLLNFIELFDKVFYEIDFFQFIGEVVYNFLKGCDMDSKEEEVNNYFMLMVIYCNV